MAEWRLPEVNRVVLGGRLTRDPDARFAGDGTPVTDLELAFHRRYPAKDGRPAEETGYVRVRTYQRLAEVCAERLRRGSAVLVEGRLQMRDWKDAQGRRQTRIEIRAENVHFMDKEAPEPRAGARTSRTEDEGGGAPS